MAAESKDHESLCCAPCGGMHIQVYPEIFGRLKADPMSRIPTQIKMARWILEMGEKVEGKSIFEVGSGHKPIVPIVFFCV